MNKKEVVEVLKEINGNPFKIPSFVKNGHIAMKMAIDALSANIINADKLIKKLDNRKDEFIKKTYVRENCEAVVTLDELIHIIRLECENEI